MKLSEKELNYILSECINYLLTEDELPPLNKRAQKQRYFNYDINHGDINFDVDDKNNRIRGGSWKPNKIKRTLNKSQITRPLANMGTYVIGGWLLSGVIGLALGGDIGQLIANIGSLAGGAAALQALGGSLNRYNKMKNLKVPSNLATAKKVAIAAAAERANLQIQCADIKERLDEQIAEYNKRYKGIEQNGIRIPLTFELLNSFLLKTSSTFKLAKNLGSEEVSVNFNTDFSNKYVSESKQNIYEDDSYDFPEDSEFITHNSSNGGYIYDNNDEVIDFSNIVGLGEVYCETYRLWYTWTKYIKVIISEFPDDLTWKDIINEVGKRQPNELLNAFYHTFFPKISKLTDAIKDRKQEPEVTKFKIIDNNYADTLSNGTVVYYVLFQDDGGEKYALRKNNNMNNIKTGTWFSVKNIEKYLTGSYLRDSETDTISIFKPSILDYAIKIR